jgi:alcohol dehydrogenase (cytochrome c)
MYYLTETDPRGAMGLGGKDEEALASMGSYLRAIDYKTGKVVWAPLDGKDRSISPGGGGTAIPCTLFRGSIPLKFGPLRRSR